MRATRTILTLGLAICLCAAMGCAELQPQQPENHFGESVRSFVHNQKLHPEPARPLDPVVGIDGRYAEKAMENYQNAPGSEAEKQKQIYEPMLKIEAVDK